MFIQRKKPQIASAPPPRPKPKSKAQLQPKAAKAGSNANSPKSVGGTGTPPRSTPTPTPTPTPSTSASAADITLDDPETYNDYKILTPPAELVRDRKYSSFKLDSRKHVSMQTWMKPVKLNRKDPPSKRNDEGDDNVQLTPMMGLDGKPVIGPDGHFVMVGPDGRPAAQHARPKLDNKGPGGFGGKKKPFQKKTKQVYHVPEATRKLRKEERYPWVVEDASGGEVWVSQLEDITKSETNAFFMPNLNAQEFFFVPSHRWYKMIKKPNYRTLGLEEAEEELAKFSKSKNPKFWQMHNQGKELIKSEPGPSTSLGPGGRRLKLVDSGERSSFNQDDEFSHTKREDDGDGDMDEVEFEEDFADDDEGGEMDAVDDEEAKELEERLKKEMMKMDRARERGAREELSDDEDEDMMELTGAGKDVRKLVRRLDKGAADDSDKEDNPYASDVDSEEEEEPEPVQTGPAVMDQSNVKPKLTNGTNTPRPAQTPGTSTPVPPPNPAGLSLPKQHQTGSPRPSAPPSRATSPQPRVVTGIVAKRATSPPVKSSSGRQPGQMRPGSPTPGGSRATSPLAGGGGSRATSPGFSPSSSRNGSGGKRKSDDITDGAPTSPGSPGLNPSSSNSSIKLNKKRKTDVDPTLGPLTEELVVEWLQRTPDATSKDCIAQFKKYIRDQSDKERFTSIVKKVASVKNGILVVKGTSTLGKRREGTPGTPGTPVAASPA